jgi:phosphoglycerate kinase
MVIEKLMKISDFVFIGGALANTFLYALGNDVGASVCEKEQKEKALEIMKFAKEGQLILPSDCLTGDPQEMEKGGVVCKVSQVPTDKQILDLGPETLARLGGLIAKAHTVIWNGPVGYFENIHFRHGTDFVYYAITQNPELVSVIGGGDTLGAISKKEYLDKITHISTGGGAMLEFIEKDTLPGIDALRGRGHA